MFEVNKKNNGPMSFFYVWGSTASMLQSHYEEAIYFLPLNSQKFLALDWSRKNEKLSRPWSHPMALNKGPLDWEFSTLTTSLLLHNRNTPPRIKGRVNYANEQKTCVVEYFIWQALAVFVPYGLIISYAFLMVDFIHFSQWFGLPSSAHNFHSFCWLFDHTVALSILVSKIYKILISFKLSQQNYVISSHKLLKRTNIELTGKILQFCIMRLEA